MDAAFKPETSVKTSGLVPQPHGGALSPGNPGNKGGGRPPDEIRRQAREDLDTWLKRLREKSAKDDPSVGEIAKAIDVLGKYGLGEKRFELDESRQLEHCAVYTATFLLDKGVPQWYEEWVAGLKAKLESL